MLRNVKSEDGKRGDYLLVASIGDSPVYAQMASGEMFLLSSPDMHALAEVDSDHRLQWQEIMAASSWDELSDFEREVWKDRNKTSNSVGEIMHLDRMYLKYYEVDEDVKRVVVGSDSVNCLSLGEMRQILTTHVNPDSAAMVLRDAISARMRDSDHWRGGDRDDITVVVGMPYEDNY